MSKAVATCFCYCSDGDQEWCALKCGHVFHKSCLDTWLSNRQGTKRWCPNCKAVIQPKDGIRPIYLDLEEECAASENQSTLPLDGRFFEKLQGKVAKLEDEKVDLEEELHSVKQECDSVLYRLAQVSDSRNKYKSRCNDMEMKVADLNVKLHNETAAHKQTQQQYATAKLNLEEQAKKHQRVVRQLGFREKIVKQLTPQQLLEVLQETLGEEQDSSSQDYQTLLKSLAEALGVRNVELAKKRDDVLRLQQDLEAVKSERLRFEERIRREHQLALKRTEDELQRAKKKEIELEYKLRLAPAAQDAAAAAWAEEDHHEALLPEHQTAGEEGAVEQGTQLSSSSLLLGLDRKQPPVQADGTDEASHAELAPELAAAFDDGWGLLEEDAAPHAPGTLLLHAATSSRGAGPSFVGKAAARLPTYPDRSSVMWRGPNGKGGTDRVLQPLLNTTSLLQKRAATSKLVQRPATKPKLAGKMGASRTSIKSFFKTAQH